MRLFLFLIGFAMLVAVTPSSADENTDPYWIGLVSAELSMRTSGVTVSATFTQKNLPKLGDCAAIALLKIIDTSKVIPTAVVTATLSIIRDAFSAPEFIAVKSDREPKIASLLLDYLRRQTSDPEIQQDIERTITFVTASRQQKQ